MLIKYEKMCKKWKKSKNVKKCKMENFEKKQVSQK